MWKADLHNHLGSDGSNLGFDETIDLVHSKLGDNSVFGIADSDDYRYERFIEQRGKYERQSMDESRAIYVPEKKVLVVKCQEMFTKEGHILAVAMPYEKNVTTKNAKDAIKAAKDLGGILDAVHPFYYQGIGNFLEQNPELLGQFSVWEVYNGSAEFSFPKMLPKDANKKSAKFYFNQILKSRLNVGISSATDGHSVNVVGKCYTKLDDLSFDSSFIFDLDNSLRRVKTLDKLHTEPNRLDAAIHTFNMVLATLQGKRKVPK